MLVDKRLKRPEIGNPKCPQSARYDRSPENGKRSRLLFYLCHHNSFLDWRNTTA